jgi:hypothetical protein
MSTPQEIQLSQDRRDKILIFLLEYFTGNEVDSKTLGHFRFLGEVFGIGRKVKDMVRASSIQGRQELALTVALAALNVCLDDTPQEPTERIIEQRERREAGKQFEVSLAGKSDGDGGACVAEPDKVVKPPSIHNRARAELSPDELERVRQLTRKRQARWRKGSSR